MHGGPAHVSAQKGVTRFASFWGSFALPSRNRSPQGSVHGLPASNDRTRSAHVWESFPSTECRFIEPGISAVQGTKQPGCASVALSK